MTILRSWTSASQGFTLKSCNRVISEYGLRLASHIFVKEISQDSLAARDGNIQEGDVVLKVRLCPSPRPRAGSTGPCRCSHVRSSFARKRCKPVFGGLARRLLFVPTCQLSRSFSLSRWCRPSGLGPPTDRIAVSVSLARGMGAFLCNGRFR